MSPSRRKQLTEEQVTAMLEDELTCEAIWEIVCRWHTMRVLFLLYCDSSIQASFSLSAISSWYDEAVEKDEEFAREMPLPVPSGVSCEAFTRLSAAQRQRSYQRFYKAVMAHWLAVETLWFAKVQVYESPRQCDGIFKHVWALWIDNQGRPLQEKIDIVEVVDFVWNFLGRKNFSVSSIPDWVDGEGEQFRRMYLDEYETETSNWAFFAECVTQYLRPSNIIELLLLSTLPSKRCWNFEQPSYLRRLGFFDVQEGVIEDTNESAKAEVHFPANVVELDVETDICSKVLGVSQGELPLDWDDEMELSEEAPATSREGLVQNGSIIGR
ncbi:hypothetical protein Asppvi_010830 [Aspergillus pseudoviridinutans]|uniref:Uncharacterized protein n=1 Tax=Aspergillus pseudoviridinutans TaxID=1517512 RepID=A0A9P3F0G7_9EURO|nr:uncharacterized protein Asppvi_010830 [Aspergillus pseudoviridinutans]GIJ91855.1 hypothetical protein Asppvi_010830 [Aspergillus pseudoviridinutans]